MSMADPPYDIDDEGDIEIMSYGNLARAYNEFQQNGEGSIMSQDGKVVVSATGGLSEEDAARVLLEKTTGLKSDEHGLNTPKRFAAMLRELTTSQDFEFTTFPAEDDDMIVMHDIPFVSVCNHHVIPFVGKAWIGYIPNEKIVGLSKLARCVQYYAKSLQVQERLTKQIAEHLMENLDPAGVAVVLEAEHFCMTIRGVQTPGTVTTTSKMTGVFADHNRTAKAEFMSIIGKG